MHTYDARQPDARAAFASWASLQRGAPRDAGSLAREVSDSQEFVGLMSTSVRGRRAVWKFVPGGKARITPAPMDIEAVDAWVAEPRSLREQSDHIAVCEVCRGEKRVRCDVCGGTGKTICSACGGQRRVFGYAANGSYRLLNCTTCRGKGEVDCIPCRRGIVVCAACAGEGRVQRWIEIETWECSTARTHPEWIARQLGWRDDPADNEIERDANLIADIEHPHRLTRADIGDIPSQWLDTLVAPLQAGERVMRQRLRIARVAFHTVAYRVGSVDDRVTFTGRRLIAPATNIMNAFARRAAKLRTTLWFLIAIGLFVTIVSLARGPFYWSIPTLISLAAFGGALASTYGAMTEWTGVRRQMRLWMIAAASFLLVAIALAIVAAPRPGHAERLIAAGQLDIAESELRALGDGTATRAWAALHLARIRKTTDIEAARAELAQIPRELPEHAIAKRAIDDLVILLNVPRAHDSVGRGDWSAAADAIVAARQAGAPATEIDPLIESIHKAGLDAAAKAKVEENAETRLLMRRVAEATLMAWERASDNWGTPGLIALRTAMARDVAAVERRRRRNG